MTRLRVRDRHARVKGRHEAIARNPWIQGHHHGKREITLKFKSYVSEERIRHIQEDTRFQIKGLELHLIAGLCTRLRILNATLESSRCEEARQYEHSQIKNQVCVLGCLS